MLIKKIYKINDKFIVNDKYDQLYKEILNKQEEDLTISDLYFLLRQNLLTELAMKKTFSIVMKNPVAGEMYQGQFLEILSENTTVFGNLFKDDYFSLDIIIQINIQEMHWDNEFDKNEFYEIYEKFKEKIALL